MSKYLLEDIWNKYMSWRTDSEEIQNIDRESFNKFLNRSMDRSYYEDSHEPFAKSFLQLFKNTYDDQTKLEQVVKNDPEFVKEYFRNCLAGMKFKDSFKLPMSFRKLLVTLVERQYWMLMFEKPEDFDELYETMYNKLNSHSNTVEKSPEVKKAEVLRQLYDSSPIQDKLEDKHIRQMSLKQIMEIYLPFNISRKALIEAGAYTYHKELASDLYRSIERIMDPDQSNALKEWETLSDDDKEFIGRMVRNHKNYSIGEFVGYENMEYISFFKRFKSLDILEAYTFKLSSSTDWWKDKSVLGNVFAVWYACKKGQVPKYVANKFGKFKPLLNLYKYTWEDIRKLILKDKEVIEALQ